MNDLLAPFYGLKSGRGSGLRFAKCDEDDIGYHSKELDELLIAGSV